MCRLWAGQRRAPLSDRRAQRSRGGGGAVRSDGPPGQPGRRQSRRRRPPLPPEGPPGQPGRRQRSPSAHGSLGRCSDGPPGQRRHDKRSRSARGRLDPAARSTYRATGRGPLGPRLRRSPPSAGPSRGLPERRQVYPARPRRGGGTAPPTGRSRQVNPDPHGREAGRRKAGKGRRSEPLPRHAARGSGAAPPTPPGGRPGPGPRRGGRAGRRRRRATETKACVEG